MENNKEEYIKSLEHENECLRKQFYDLENSNIFISKQDIEKITITSCTVERQKTPISFHNKTYNLYGRESISVTLDIATSDVFQRFKKIMENNKHNKID